MISHLQYVFSGNVVTRHSDRCRLELSIVDIRQRDAAGHDYWPTVLAIAERSRFYRRQHWCIVNRADVYRAHHRCAVSVPVIDADGDCTHQC